MIKEIVIDALYMVEDINAKCIHSNEYEDLSESIANIILNKNIVNNMPLSLTYENGAKSLLIGEFSESIEVSGIDCEDGSETVVFKVPVEWDTIKNIYKKIVEHFYK